MRTFIVIGLILTLGACAHPDDKTPKQINIPIIQMDKQVATIPNIPIQTPSVKMPTIVQN